MTKASNQIDHKRHHSHCNSRIIIELLVKGKIPSNTTLTHHLQRDKKLKVLFSKVSFKNILSSLNWVANSQVKQATVLPKCTLSTKGLMYEGLHV